MSPSNGLTVAIHRDQLMERKGGNLAAEPIALPSAGEDALRTAVALPKAPES